MSKQNKLRDTDNRRAVTTGKWGRGNEGGKVGQIKGDRGRLDFG